MAEFHVDAEAADDVYNDAAARAADGENPWPSMTYIEGVRDALAWVLGDDDEDPFVELPEYGS